MSRLVLIAILAVQVRHEVLSLRLIPNPHDQPIGGKDALLDQFPFQVSLRYYGVHRCSGAIVQSNVILTAAQCVQSVSRSQLVIVAGITHLNDYGMQRKAKRILPNKSFSIRTYDNDVAIIVLDTPLFLSSGVQPIKLAAQNDELNGGSKGVMSGWSTNFEYGPFLKNLKFSEVSILNQTECNYIYGGIITKNMICANISKEVDTCNGDMGGLLSIDGKLYGITSLGFECNHSKSNTPIVFSRIPALRQWIDEQLLIYNLLSQ